MKKFLHDFNLLTLYLSLISIAFIASSWIFTNVGLLGYIAILIFGVFPSSLISIILILMLKFYKASTLIGNILCVILCSLFVGISALFIFGYIATFISLDWLTNRDRINSIMTLLSLLAIMNLAFFAKYRKKIW